MMIEMRARSQFTLPSKLVKKMGIREGDKFEVVEHGEGIFLCPVVSYPKATIERLAKIMEEHVHDPAAVYDDIEDIVRDLGLKPEGDDV